MVVYFFIFTLLKSYNNIKQNIQITQSKHSSSKKEKNHQLELFINQLVNMMYFHIQMIKKNKLFPFLFKLNNDILKC